MQGGHFVLQNMPIHKKELQNGCSIPQDWQLADDTWCEVSFCFPDSKQWRATVFGLIGLMTHGRYWRSDGPRKAQNAQAIEIKDAQAIAELIKESICIMCNNDRKKQLYILEEIMWTMKKQVALQDTTGKIKYYADRPSEPTAGQNNTEIEIDDISVWQSRGNTGVETIQNTLQTAFLDYLDFPDLNPFDGSSKIDTMNDNLVSAVGELQTANTKLETTNGLLTYLYKAFYAGFDINPFLDETIFGLLRRSLNDTGTLNDVAYLSKIKDSFDYHVGEIQYGIKHFFNIFAVGTTDEFLNFGQKIKKYWDKPNTEDELLVLQNSIFQNNPDYLGRGFTFYDFMTMWIKPHGENWQGNGYVNPATNQKGHEPRTLDIGGLSALDTLIERFSLAFLQTSNTTPILGKIRDILQTGLLFSDSLSILTLINNSLQSIWGVLDVDLGWMARSLDEIAAKDCCDGANQNGSDTVTNPDGSQTTTPKPPIYPPIDPNDPESPTKEPYQKDRPDTSQANRDGACGFLYYWLNQVADFLEFILNVFNPLWWLFKLVGWSGISDKLDELSWTSYWLAKIPSQRLRNMATTFFNFLAKNGDNANIVRWVLDTLPGTIRAYADDVACGANGQPEPPATLNLDDVVGSLIEYVEEQLPTPDDLVLGFVGQAAYIVLDYFMSDTALADYEQYCPCPSYPSGITGQWNLNNGLPNPYTLTQTGSTVTFTNANGTVTGQGTLSGLVLTGTWVNSGNSTNGTFTWTFNGAITSFTGTGVNSTGTSFNWSGNKV